MEKSEALLIMQKWYARLDVVYELCFNSFVRRECAVLTPKIFKEQCRLTGVRYLRILSAKGFDYAMNQMVKYKQFECPLNIYYSLARYKKGLPQMSCILKLRGKEIEQWNERYVNEIEAYDCLIDFDADSHQEMDIAKESARNVITFLDAKNIPYHLRFSGMGYHIIIPHEAFLCVPHHFNPYENNDENIYRIYNNITQFFHDEFSEMVDVGLHDSRRVVKAPYSLALYDDGAFVCWEFHSREEFEMTNWQDFKIYELRGELHFKAEKKIYRRGQHLFNANIPFFEKNISELVSRAKEHVARKEAEEANNTEIITDEELEQQLTAEGL